MMNEVLDFVRELNEPVSTRYVAEAVEMPISQVFEILNDAAKEGILLRQGLLVENGTERPILCFGWSCPAP